MNQGKYREAIDKFLAARHCDDKPKEDDLDALVKKAQDAWVEALEIARKEAETTKIAALLAENEAKTQALIARENERKAQSGLLAARAMRIYKKDNTSALNLAIAAFLKEPTSEAAFAIDEITSNPQSSFYDWKYTHEESQLTAMAVSPDSRKVVVADSRVKVTQIDLETKESITFGGVIPPVTVLKYSPDGKKIAGGCRNGLIFIWDSSGREMKRIYEVRQEIKDLCFSEDGRFILTAHDNNSAHLWDMSGQKICTVESSSSQYMYCVALSQDGKIIATGGADRAVTLWNIEGKKLQEIGFNASVMSINFSKDGKSLFISGGMGFGEWGFAEMYSLYGEKLVDFPVGGSTVHRMAELANGWVAVAGLEDGQAKIFTKEGKEVCGLVYPEESERLNEVELSKDGRFLFTTDQHGNIRRWPLEQPEVLSLRGHSGGVKQLAMSPDGSQVASISWDGTLRWYQADGKLIKSIPARQHLTKSMSFDDSGRLVEKTNSTKHHFTSLTFTPDGAEIVTGGTDSTLTWWNKEGEPVKIKTPHPSSIKALKFAAGQQNPCVLFQNNSLQFLDLNKSISHSDNNPTIGFEFSPDGKFFLLLLRNFTGVLYAYPDFQNGPIHEFSNLPVHRVDFSQEDYAPVAFSPDGKFVAFGRADGIVTIFDLEKKEAITHFEGHQKQINDLAFSPDGKYLLSGSTDGTAKLWLLDGTPIQTFLGHQSYLTMDAFSKDGSYELVLDDQPTFEVTIDGMDLLPKYSEVIVTSVAFSSDGRYIWTGSTDGTVRKWARWDYLLPAGVIAPLDSAQKKEFGVD